MSRALRTTIPENPQTQGERIRFARLTAEMPVAPLADVTVRLYDTLIDTSDLDGTTLNIIAAALARP